MSMKQVGKHCPRWLLSRIWGYQHIKALWGVRRQALKGGGIVSKSLQRELQSTHKTGSQDRARTWTSARTSAGQPRENF